MGRLLHAVRQRHQTEAGRRPRRGLLELHPQERQLGLHLRAEALHLHRPVELPRSRQARPTGRLRPQRLRIHRGPHGPRGEQLVPVHEEPLLRGQRHKHLQPALPFSPLRRPDAQPREAVCGAGIRDPDGDRSAGIVLRPPAKISSDFGRGEACSSSSGGRRVR